MSSQTNQQTERQCEAHAAILQRLKLSIAVVLPIRKIIERRLLDTIELQTERVGILRRLQAETTNRTGRIVRTVVARGLIRNSVSGFPLR